MADFEPWREALAAFYERDGMPAKARRLRDGEPFDYLDMRTIRALEAALETMREAA